MNIVLSYRDILAELSGSTAKRYTDERRIIEITIEEERDRLIEHFRERRTVENLRDYQQRAENQFATLVNGYLQVEPDINPREVLFYRLNAPAWAAAQLIKEARKER